MIHSLKRPKQAIARIELHEWRALLQLRKGLVVSNITIDKEGSLHLLLEGEDDDLFEISSGGSVPSLPFKQFVKKIKNEIFSSIGDQEHAAKKNT